MDHCDVVIIGAGVIGLAAAAALSKANPGLEIIVVEEKEQFGLETSSRNSEVIHSGLYYPPGSLKSRLCISGNRELYDFCRECNIPHNRTGKLIVAPSEDELPLLEGLRNSAVANGLKPPALLSGREVSRLEPAVSAWAALHVESTGIIDSYRLMKVLAAHAEAQGAFLACRHRVTAVESGEQGNRITYINPDGSEETLSCDLLVNCAGLYADRLAASAGIDPDREGYRIYPCKGEYFRINPTGQNRVSRLVYPPPHHDLRGLGIHLTISLDGRMRLGPNAIYTEHPDYRVDPAHRRDFYLAAKEYLPHLREEDLEPEMAGVRPKLQAPGDPFRDFIIRREARRGMPGLINLVGIESPGLTCCLSIAAMVCSLAGFRGGSMPA